jgi:SagB-type dehydrogenase family enzyme
MREKLWQEILLPSGSDDHLWEVFHENSKLGRLSESISEDVVVARMRQYAESLPFVGYPIVELPAAPKPFDQLLREAIMTRVSSRDLVPTRLALDDIATMLHCAYGETRDNKDTAFPRPFRVVPSAGALYPLELFLYNAHEESLQSGLYHYNPSKHHLRLLRHGDSTMQLAGCVVQPEIVRGAALIIFITALFERTTFKYGDRGYRFALLEAGHVAQNLNLVANALGLGSVNIGGYYDRDVDDYIGLDGVTHSTIYIVAVGMNSGEAA